jgi:hypothetical protein
MRAKQSSWQWATRIALAMTSVCGAWATPPLTTVQDQLYRADGSAVNGTLIVSWPAFTASDNSNVPANTLRVNVSGGLLRVKLVPTTTALTAASYTVQYILDGRLNNSEVWNVPVSTAPVSVAAVRQSASGGGGTVGNVTAVQIADVTGLSDALTDRPARGANFLPGRILTPDTNGNLSGLAGTAEQCIRGDGSLGECGTKLAFHDLETPGGALDGNNATFTLAEAPSPAASLLLFRNGLLQKPGGDYTLSGATITFAAGSVPQPGDLLAASYRVGP